VNFSKQTCLLFVTSSGVYPDGVIFFRETTRHAIAKPVVGYACTKPTTGLGDYVTTVTMMSAEGAKNACLVD